MTSSTRPTDPGFATLALHAGGGQPDACAVLEERIVLLEGGTAAVALRSGEAAPVRALHALLDPGDGLLVTAGLHASLGPTLTRAAEAFGWVIAVVDSEAGAFADAVTGATRAILAESLIADGRVADLAATADLADARGLALLVDNTRATPALVRPVERRAHAVVHRGAATLAGRADVEAGLIVDGGTGWARVPKLARAQPSLGGRSFADRYGNFALVAAVTASGLAPLAPPPSPADATAILSGLATLALRTERRVATAAAVARHLERHPAVATVESPRGPIVAVRFGADAPKADRFQLFGPAEDPAGLRSAVLGTGTTCTLVLGLEDAADLTADLDQVLAGAS